SQGVAMTFRAAATSTLRVRGVIACGGDVPPELQPNALARIQSVLLGRGARDEWYTEEKLEADERRLRDAGVSVRVIRYEGAQEWTPEFSRAAGSFLDACRSPFIDAELRSSGPQAGS